ncbi:MAG TPA: hypothetical protein VFK13_04415 [Gemmatimonadaceae bacterium]|nr:hypothetical protein [Gemmatimonadaceae bacterium]
MRMWRRMTLSLCVFVGLASAAGMLSCDADPVAPGISVDGVPGDSVRVTLSKLIPSVAPSRQLLLIEASIGGSTFVPANRYVPIVVTTSGGDRVEAQLDNPLCVDRQGLLYACHSMLYGLDGTRAGSEIEQELALSGIRTEDVVIGGDIIVARSLRGSDGAQLDLIASTEGVRSVDFNRIATGASGIPIEGGAAAERLAFEQGLRGAIGLNPPPVRLDDDALEVAPGETITIRYVQPFGVPLTASTKF